MDKAPKASGLANRRQAEFHLSAEQADTELQTHYPKISTLATSSKTTLLVPTFEFLQLMHNALNASTYHD